MHKEQEDAHHKTRYFNRSDHPNATANSKSKQERSTNNQKYSPSEAENNQFSFKCPGKCKALQKEFSQKDEFDLHMTFYHEAAGTSQSQ